MPFLWLLLFGGAMIVGVVVQHNRSRGQYQRLRHGVADPPLVPAPDGSTLPPEIDAFVTGMEEAVMSSNAANGIGMVLPLTQDQQVYRARYMIGEVDSSGLDPYVRTPAMKCAVIYYRLEFPNGGLDPTNKDPAARWLNDAKNFTFITADCVAAAAWIGGWSRKQPVRFAHLYSGSINTNSMIMDAEGPQKCFQPLAMPVPGCLIVCKSGSPGHAVGHVGVVIFVPPDFDPTKRSSWQGLVVANIASMGAAMRANVRTTGVGWFGTGALFLKSIMTP